MGLVEMIKNRVELFKIERYTKRRAVNTPDFEQKGLSLCAPIFVSVPDCLSPLHSSFYFFSFSF